MVLSRLEWNEETRFADHRHGQSAQGLPRGKPQPKSCSPSKSKSAASISITSDADGLFIELKERHGLKWEEIHR
jgi:hypothetical protein